MSWRTMKSVPKDGRPVLLYCDFADSKEVVVARYNARKAGTGPYGRFVWQPCEGSHIAERVPTHWRPLPKLPT